MNLHASRRATAPKGFGNALPYYVLVGLVVITAFLQQRQTMRNQTAGQPADADHRQGHAGDLRVHLDQHPGRCGPLLLHLQPLADRPAGGRVPDRSGPRPDHPREGRQGWRRPRPSAAVAKGAGDRGQEHGDRGPARDRWGEGAVQVAVAERGRDRGRRPSGNGKPRTQGRGSAKAKRRARPRSDGAKSTPPKSTPTAEQEAGGSARAEPRTRRRKNNRKRKR